MNRESRMSINLAMACTFCSPTFFGADLGKRGSPKVTRFCACVHVVVAEMSCRGPLLGGWEWVGQVCLGSPLLASAAERDVLQMFVVVVLHH